MTPIDVLMEEHRIIERVLDVLERAAQNLSVDSGGSADFFLKAVDFIQGFADGCHHQKEEGVLFEVLVALGLSKTAGPVAVMLAEHEQGRHLTQTLQEGARRLQAGESAAVSLVTEGALGYVALLRGHIRKEDCVLFPLANRIIPAEQRQQMVADFERITREENRQENIREKYLRLVVELENAVGA